MSEPLFSQDEIDRVPRRIKGKFPNEHDPNARHVSFARISSVKKETGSFENQHGVNRTLAEQLYQVGHKVEEVQDDITSEVPFLERPNANKVFQTMSRGDHAYFAYSARAFRYSREAYYMMELCDIKGVFLHFNDIALGKPITAVKKLPPGATNEIASINAYAEHERDTLRDRVHTGMKTTYGRNETRGNTPPWTDRKGTYYRDNIMLLRRIIAVLHRETGYVVARRWNRAGITTFQHYNGRGEKMTESDRFAEQWDPTSFNKIPFHPAVGGILNQYRWIYEEDYEEPKEPDNDLYNGLHRKLVYRPWKKDGKVRILDKSTPNHYLYPVQVFQMANGPILHQWEDWRWRDAPDGQPFNLMYNNPEGYPVDHDGNKLAGEFVDTDKLAPIMTPKQIGVLARICESRFDETNLGDRTDLFVNMLQGIVHCNECGWAAGYHRNIKEVNEHRPYIVTPDGVFRTHDQAIDAWATHAGKHIGRKTAYFWILQGKNGWRKEARHKDIDTDDQNLLCYEHLFCKKAHEYQGCDHRKHFPFGVALRLVMVLAEIIGAHNEWWQSGDDQAEIDQLNAKIAEAEAFHSRLVKDATANRNMDLLDAAKTVREDITQMQSKLSRFTPGFLVEIYAPSFLQELLAEYRRLEAMPLAGKATFDQRRLLNGMIGRLAKDIRLCKGMDYAVRLQPANGRYIEFLFTKQGQYKGYCTRDEKTDEKIDDDPNVIVDLAEMNRTLNSWGLDSTPEP